GAQRGGRPLRRSHVYQILTNPIYAGRIRHHKAVYAGQHPALIDPKRWDALQDLLRTDAARTRGRANAGAKAALCGKIADDAGEMLTPTHTIKAGKRIRYYISRCLVAGKARDHPTAWRLPAVVFEDRIAAVITDTLSDESYTARLLPEVHAAQLQVATRQAQQVGATLRKVGADRTLALVDRITLEEGQITITLDRKRLCSALKLSPDAVSSDALTWTTPLSLKRRGVETRVIIGAQTASVDPVLLRNIQTARGWYQQIIDGATFTQVMAQSGTNSGRFKKMITLALLAPDLLAQITSGTQPVGFTSQWVKTNTLPMCWDAQRALLKRL
ncbi:hypothetical protein AN191_18380, partial [Loktanella sp. 5RATIMAR09]|uniref:recombinase family protein n=1 Tax=Loktanella sp. 5RATIMAR09 TaxID=1225655 RepID=UPI0007081C91